MRSTHAGFRGIGHRLRSRPEAALTGMRDGLPGNGARRETLEPAGANAKWN